MTLDRLWKKTSPSGRPAGEYWQSLVHLRTPAGLLRVINMIRKPYMSPMTKMFLAAAAICIAFAGQAMAHAHLKSAVPAADGTVKAAPSELDLTFTESLNLKFSGIKVTGPAKAAVKTGEGMLMNGDTTLMVPVTDKLAPGKYTVEWHVLSTDGHKTNGTYSFTIAP